MGITNEEQQIKAEIEAQLFLKNHNIDYYERATVDAVVLIMEQYEQRLKADMVAMLTEIQMEYSEYASVWMEWNNTMSKEQIAEKALKASKYRMIDLLQQKIDKLKE